MGTRSITTIEDERGNVLVKLYCQYDGYPEGVGKQLKQLCEGKQFVNGYNPEHRDEYPGVFNGIRCFSMWLIGELKESIGSWYLTTPIDSGEHIDYCYKIKPKEMKPVVDFDDSIMDIDRSLDEELKRSEEKE